MSEKNKKTKEEIFEIVIVILLGITAVFMAWASWISSLHGGNQATNYATSNNLAADGNSRWNEAVQSMTQDMITWNTISDLLIEISFADENGDTASVEKNQWKLDQIIADNTTDEFKTAIDWAMEQEEYASPFEMEGYSESYFEDAQACLDKSEAVLKQGEEDNKNGDAFGLVTVIYSVVLFLLGIVSTFKSFINKLAVTGISIVAFVLATIYMSAIPMPTGFQLFGFFGIQ